MSPLSSLGLAAALGGSVAATATGSEASTTVALEATAALAACPVTTATTSTTAARSEAVASIGVAAGTALLDEDLLTIDLVRVGGNGGSVARGLGELNESAVLEREKSAFRVGGNVGNMAGYEPWGG